MRHNILCVDELGVTRIELTNILSSLKVNITNVKNEVEVVNILREKDKSFNAIVWTINSFDLNEFDAIKRLKGKEAYNTIPVVIVSKFTDKKYVIKAIECGAVEYIAKPYDEETVVKKMCKILGVAFGKPQGTEVEDIITFSFADMLNKEMKGASRGGYCLSIMMAAVVNNQIPVQHDDSSEIVEVINKVIGTKLRDTDTSFLYGSGNLIVILPFADKEGSRVVENKVREIFNTHSVIKQKNKSNYSLITVSVTYPEDGKIKDKLLKKLEENLRNCMRASK